MTGWWLIGVKETTVYLCMPGDFEEGLCFLCYHIWQNKRFMGILDPPLFQQAISRKKVFSAFRHVILKSSYRYVTNHYKKTLAIA